ncbi:HlyD family type I secretion periplasmic adaptor subunit [Kistimonas asteriae]|uniref:HlyD family type I secretion periplasmic adaptor subunit n=1 Tax=Kistimonas asteriae TaxID=517724 RepID=UPI001BA4D050|nr:HlyD family type I secretion periplasmic adaptor subunit [Kistimonas asteriae]
MIKTPARPATKSRKPVPKRNTRNTRKPNVRRDSADLQYMADIHAAQLQDAPVGARALLWLGLVAVLAVLTWMGWAQLDEITRGNGKVVPSSRLQVVQNLEGGILDAIYVSEGDQVEVGQTLMHLDEIRFSSSLQEAEVEYYSILATIARLRAEAEQRPLIFPRALDRFPASRDREQALYRSRRQSLETSLTIVQEQTEQQEQALRALRSRRAHLQKSYELSRKELELTRPMAEKGVISEVELLQLKQKVNDLLSELRNAELDMPRLSSTLEENRARERDVLLDFQEQARETLRENEIRLARMTESRKSLRDQVTRRQVKSLVKGVIKKVHVNTIGGVVQPGMDLVEIVPLQDHLLVETMIAPKDIAFLRKELDAVVKLTAYDFAIYGGLQGKVDHISADTITNEQGESFYLVRIRTDRNWLGTAEKPLHIIPGMVASVDIITGKKTVLDYLLKPVLRAKANALTER